MSVHNGTASQSSPFLPRKKQRNCNGEEGLSSSSQLLNERHEDIRTREDTDLTADRHGTTGEGGGAFPIFFFACQLSGQSWP